MGEASASSPTSSAERSSVAGVRVIPNAAWSVLPQHPGPHRVLLLLWQFSGWRPEVDEPAFAWPSIDTLAERLAIRPRAVRDALAKLRELGYVREAREHRLARGRRDEREGWRLFESPAAAEDFDREQAAASQMELFAGAPGEAVDNLCTTEHAATDLPAQVSTERAQVRTKPCAGEHEIGPGEHRSKDRDGVELVIASVVNVGAPEHDDDDAAKIWRDYEAQRVAMLGGTLRDGPPPASLRTLIDSHGAPAVAAYATRAIELAAAAVARGRSSAPNRVAERSDGREWHPGRLAAVMAWREPDTPAVAAAPIVVPRAMPPPDPVVDGERVTRFELDAWREGGADAVRALRAAPTLTGESAERLLRQAGWMQQRPQHAAGDGER